MLNLNWPLTIVITLGLYSSMIVLLPFNPQLATLMLFALIAFWSRLPGVGIPHPFFVILNLDVVDVFTLLVAINVGSVAGAFFTIFCNLASRLVGVFPKWDCILLDALFQSILSFICPFIYAVTGNLLATMMTFTIARELMFFMLWFIYPRWGFAQEILKTVVSAASILLINSFYTKLFGNFFSNLIAKGVAFSWVLFLFTTIVILIFGITVFGLSPKKAAVAAGRNVKAIISHQLRKSDNTNLRIDDDVQFVRDALK